MFGLFKKKKETPQEYELIVTRKDGTIDNPIFTSKEQAEIHKKNYEKLGYDVKMNPVFEKGGYVAVAEKGDYITIISRPTTKEQAEQMLDAVLEGETGKVITLEEARAHKHAVGQEYLYENGGEISANDWNIFETIFLFKL